MVRMGKRKFQSRVLTRYRPEGSPAPMVHYDRFYVGGAPRLLVLFIGGSGISPGTYARLSGKPAYDVLVPLMERLAQHHQLVFAYVTAPFFLLSYEYDEEDHHAADADTRLFADFVTQEVLPDLALAEPLPIALASHSGGAALAFSELHTDLGPRVISGAAFASDQIPDEFVPPKEWPPFPLAYGEADKVQMKNRRTLERLLATGRARLEILESGGGDPHQLRSYLGAVEAWIDDVFQLLDRTTQA